MFSLDIQHQNDHAQKPCQNAPNEWRTKANRVKDDERHDNALVKPGKTI
jgi:hypothetical protein